MLWPILFVVFFLVFSRKSKQRPDVTETLIFSGILGVLGVFFALFIGAVLPIPTHLIEEEGERVQLVSLRNGTETTGSAFLGFGSIGTTQYYFFFKAAGRGYQQGKIEANDNVTVIEAPRTDGELRTYVNAFNNSSSRWIAMHELKKKYEFIIPEGSLQRNFTLQ